MSLRGLRGSPRPSGTPAGDDHECCRLTLVRGIHSLFKRDRVRSSGVDVTLARLDLDCGPAPVRKGDDRVDFVVGLVAPGVDTPTKRFRVNAQVADDDALKWNPAALRSRSRSSLPTWSAAVPIDGSTKLCVVVGVSRLEQAHRPHA